MKSINMRLQKAKKIALLILVAIQLSACEDFLNTSPSDFLTPNTSYSSQSQLTNALVGIYAPLLTSEVYGLAIPTLQSGITDEAYYMETQTTPNNDVGLHTQSYTSYVPNRFWQQCYIGIERANQLMENISNAKSVDTTFVKAVFSEAKFLRAYYHFLLVQNYGDIPLKITSTVDATKTNTPRTPSIDVYNQIIKDMSEAEAGLPTFQSSIYSNASSRITKTSAQGILARVCLYMAGYPVKDETKYTDAIFWAKKVKESALHSLFTRADTLSNVTNLIGVRLSYDSAAVTSKNPGYKNNGYSQLFVNMASNVYSTKESMWEIDASILSSTVYAYNSLLGAQCGLVINPTIGHPKMGRSIAWDFVHQYFFDSFANGDLRRDWAIAPYVWNYNTTTTVCTKGYYPAGQSLGRAIGKWRREYEPMGSGFTTKPAWNTQINFPVIRYSDVLLMLCEAEYKVNGATETALDAINQVRRRAFGYDPLTSNARVDLTAATLTLDEIQKERSRELCFEGLRRADLIRWGIYMQRMQDVINYDNLKGNPSGNRYLAVMSPNNAITAGNKILLWPIPSNEVLVNQSITQNPGY